MIIKLRCTGMRQLGEDGPMVFTLVPIGDDAAMVLPAAELKIQPAAADAFVVDGEYQMEITPV